MTSRLRAPGEWYQPTTSHSRQEFTIDQTPSVLISYSHPATSCLIWQSCSLLPLPLCQRASQPWAPDLVPFDLSSSTVSCARTHPFQKSTSSSYSKTHIICSKVHAGARLGSGTELTCPVAAGVGSPFPRNADGLFPGSRKQLISSAVGQLDWTGFAWGCSTSFKPFRP